MRMRPSDPLTEAGSRLNTSSAAALGGYLGQLQHSFNGNGYKSNLYVFVFHEVHARPAYRTAVHGFNRVHQPLDMSTPVRQAYTERQGTKKRGNRYTYTLALKNLMNLILFSFSVRTFNLLLTTVIALGCFTSAHRHHTQHEVHVRTWLILPFHP